MNKSAFFAMKSRIPDHSRACALKTMVLGN